VRELIERLSREQSKKMNRSFDVMADILGRAGFDIFGGGRGEGYEISHPKTTAVSVMGGEPAMNVEATKIRDDDNIVFTNWVDNPKGAAKAVIAYARKHWGIK